MRPSSGDVNIGRTTLGQRPTLAPLASFADQIRTPQSPFAVARAAPQSPPMRAWLELDGRPSHHVKIFQMIAPNSAQNTVSMSTALASTRPPLIVFATAVPAKAPMRFQKAAQIMAARGVSTFVETTVAIALAGS